MQRFMRTCSILAAASLSLGTFGFSTPAQGESLQEAVRFMIESAPDLKSIGYNRLAREQEVRQARSGYLPKVDFMAGAGIDDVKEPFDDTLDPREYTLSLRQNLFTGLATKNEVERQEARVRSEAHLLQATTEHIALKASRVYLEVLRNQELVELARENLLMHERIADQISLRSESGVDRRADMDQITSRLALARSNQVVTETNLADAQSNYLAVVGRLPSALNKPQSLAAHLPPSMEEAVARGVKSHPQLKSAQADLEARAAQEKVARSPFLPVIDLEVDKNWSEEANYSYDERDDLIAMLRLRYNLFHGLKDQARKEETTLLLSEAREVRNSTQRQVEEAIRLSWMAHKNVQTRTPYLQQRWQAASQTAHAYARQWDIGKRSLLDVLDAEAEKIEARKELVNAGYDGEIAQYRILDGMGVLVHSLGLEWPKEAAVEAERQDPAEQPQG